MLLQGELEAVGGREQEGRTGGRGGQASERTTKSREGGGVGGREQCGRGGEGGRERASERTTKSGPGAWKPVREGVYGRVSERGEELKRKRGSKGGFARRMERRSQGGK